MGDYRSKVPEPVRVRGAREHGGGGGLGSQLGHRLVAHYNGRGTLGGFELRLATILFLFQKLCLAAMFTVECVCLYM